MADDPMNMFAGIKKKKKKQVNIADLDVESGDATPAQATPEQAAEDAVRPLEKTADLTLHDDEPLDFSDLKKKKNKKAVAVSLEDVASPGDEPTNLAANVDKLGNVVQAEAVEAAPATEESPLEDFSGLKKKKKSKKTALDLEAFEKELAAVEKGEQATSGDASPAVQGGSDTEMAEDEAPVEGEDPFVSEDADGKSRAEVIAEKKLWLSEPDRDYTYTELLGRFYSLHFSSHPTLSRDGGKKRYTIPPPNVQREGSKRTLFVNVADICKRMRRTPEHVIQFLFSELGTSGSVDGSQRLVIKGRFQQKQIENVLRRYIVEYVTCKICKSPDTTISKDNRIFFVTCNTCKSKNAVSSIKVGFQAQTKRRPKAA